MPLLPINALEEDFICPRCSSPLVNTTQKCRRCGLQIEKVHGAPVLVDFETSVLSRESLLTNSAKSPVLRAQHVGLRALPTKLLRGTNKTAQKEVHTLSERAKLLRDRPRILVIGGGAIGSGLEGFYTRPDLDIIGFDIYNSPHVQFVADAHKIPLRSQSVDAVIVQAVLEHVVDPPTVVAEIQRVLKKQGIVYADTPFLQHVHEGPYDFTRFTESGHRYLFRHFDEISSGAVGGLGTQLLWSVDYLFRGIFRSREAAKVALILFFWLRWFDRFIPEEYSIDGAPGCFFLGTLSETVMTPKELIRRYRGAQKITSPGTL